MGIGISAGRMGGTVSRLVPVLALFSCAEGFMGEGGRGSDGEEPSAFPELSFAEGPSTAPPSAGCEGVADDDGDRCTDDVCVPEVGETFHFPIVIDDADACTIDACDSVLGIVRTELDCDDGTSCTSDGCHEDVGCFHVPIVYFNETFSTSDHWSLEGFDIGPLALSAEPGAEPDLALHVRFDGPASMVVATTSLELHPLSGAWLRYAFTLPPAHATLRVEVHADGEWTILDEIPGTGDGALPDEAQPDDDAWHVATVPISPTIADGALLRFAVLIDDNASVSGDVFIDDVKVLPAASCP